MAQVDTKHMPFWKVYTPKNIYVEAMFRLKRLNSNAATNSQSTLPKTTAYDDSHTRQVGEFYDTYHDKFLRCYGNVIQAFRTKDWQDLLGYEMASMKLKPGQKLLDAGCGVGVPAIFFAQKADVRVDAITISQKQYEAARNNIRIENLSGRVKVIKGDYHRLHEYFEPQSYDVICFLESFGHSRAKEHLLCECWTMLKPGGLLYIKDLFRRVPILQQQKSKIDAEILKINSAYHYEIADVNMTLDQIRAKGYILSSLQSVNLELSDFEDLAISNEFQELTGIACIDNWEEYVFPVDFFEIKCIKPDFDINQRQDRHFLQNLYWKQAVKE
jgi:SAM-dependent methyltransferase